ncbi:hypothetical protein GCM10027425_07870 [Alteromonas gracilis]
MEATRRTWLVIGLVVALCLGIVGGATALVRAHPPVESPSIDRRDADGPPQEPERRRALAVAMPIFFVGLSKDRPYLYREEVLTRESGDEMLTQAVRALLEGGSRDPDHQLMLPLDLVEVDTSGGRPVVRLRGDVADPDPAHPEAGLFAQAVVHTVTSVRGLSTAVLFEVNDGADTTLRGVDVSEPQRRDEDLIAPVRIRVPAYDAVVPRGSLVQGDSDLPEGGTVSFVVRGAGVTTRGTQIVHSDGRFEFPVEGRPGRYEVEVTAVVEGVTVVDSQAFDVR